jgi:hypothetical protein
MSWNCPNQPDCFSGMSPLNPFTATFIRCMLLSPECDAGNDQIPNSLASEILTAMSKISLSSGKAG